MTQLALEIRMPLLPGPGFGDSDGPFGRRDPNVEDPGVLRMVEKNSHNTKSKIDPDIRRWGDELVRRLQLNFERLTKIDASIIPLAVYSKGTTGGTGSAGAGNQYVEMTIQGTTYKVLHDGTV